MDREFLGQLVRMAWVAWAKEQPDVDQHPHWLTEWANLPERDREVDRRIGETIANVVAIQYENATIVVEARSERLLADALGKKAS